MKRKTDLINRIRSFVTELSAQKTRFEIDQNVIEWTGELQIGTELSAVEGNLPESFSLEDGRLVTIEDCKVTELTESEEEVELQTAEETSEDEELEVELQEDEEEVVEEQPEEEPEVDEAEQRLSAVESRLDELVNELNSLQEAMKEREDKYSELLNRVEELAKAPAVPAKKTEVSNNFNKTESRAAKIFASN